jgi:hypothetical protein
MVKKKLTLVVIIFVALVSHGIAAPIYSPVTGHYYETDPTWMNWNEAKTVAESRTYVGMTGYLATLTTFQENQWVWDNVLPGGYPFAYWLGGYQDPVGQGADKNWRWVTGEVWSWTNWYGVEPADSFGQEEDKLQFLYNGQWNDCAANVPGGGFVVEYGAVPEPASILLLAMSALLFIPVRKKLDIVKSSEKTME